MTQPSKKSPGRRLCVVVCLAALPISILATPERSSETSVLAQPGSGGHSAEAAYSAQKAYIDPATGQLSQAPPAGTFAAQGLAHAVDAPVQRSFDGLFEVELPNGAIQVDLEGRFRSALVATVQEDGGFTLDCDRSRTKGDAE